MVFEPFYGLFFFRTFHIDGLRARFDIDGAMTDKRGFGHKKDNKQKHEDEGTSHAMHDDAVRACLED
jgi:hypothetical protein